jgi:hypothetical protein
VSTPAPRPALKKAADAHIHPAAPGHSPRGLKQADDGAEAAEAGAPSPAENSPAPTSDEAKGHRLTAPPRGATSDSLRSRTRGRRSRGGERATKPEKTVELTVKVPKSLRRDFRDAVKSEKKDPNDVVTALLRAWLDS